MKGADVCNRSRELPPPVERVTTYDPRRHARRVRLERAIEWAIGFVGLAAVAYLTWRAAR